MGRLGLGLTRRARRRRPVAAAPAAGVLATAFPAAPAVHYHFNNQEVAVDGASRLVACPDLRGLADLAAGPNNTAPVLMTDALGRAFLRFHGGEAAAIANTLVMATNRSFMALLVGRVHHQQASCHILNPRYATYSDAATNTFANAVSGYLRVTSANNSVGFLNAGGGTPTAAANAADCHKVIPGTQMQVLAVASRPTADGGTRYYCNLDACDAAQQTTQVANYLGGIVGGSAFANNSETMASSANDVFDLYELAIWTAGPANPAADAIVAAAVANHAVPQLTRQLVVTGDSLTYGALTTLSESPARVKGLGSRLTEPGSAWVPGDLRVISSAVSGFTVASLVSQRDAANSIFAVGRYPGGAANNLVAFEIGRNDMAQTATSAAVHRANLAALIDTPELGYLQRGWRVVAVGNRASAAAPISGAPDAPVTLQQRIEAVRAMLFDGTAIDSAFQAEVQAGPGQAYEGLVSVLPLHEIAWQGAARFKTSADAADTAAGYYDNDSTHPRVAGVDLAISGGDTPAYGYASIV